MNMGDIIYLFFILDIVLLDCINYCNFILFFENFILILLFVIILYL